MMDTLTSALSRLEGLRLYIGPRERQGEQTADVAAAVAAEFGSGTMGPRPYLRAFTDAQADSIADACAEAAALALAGGEPDEWLLDQISAMVDGRFPVSMGE
ncbi:Hypothetical protein GbCGDNIH9_1577 [Granulibacter bethesdensis]|uniref:Uncharacterized protein n=1 Tax=Granulibacter bethesdensis TaxID=364410 RepID=A0AAC9KA56_9PROT|nr:hypothetical protein [Granulibacter bethesdensis]APH54866.1 Hypothetical protein GbCGDNIH9_1577 [Granulibacter bethesdensis]APH62452.1 Hypothetical protein GbCGDNIH8_1577 [Granulibacter bethesdensis]